MARMASLCAKFADPNGRHTPKTTNPNMPMASALVKLTTPAVDKPSKLKTRTREPACKQGLFAPLCKVPIPCVLMNVSGRASSGKLLVISAQHSQERILS